MPPALEAATLANGVGVFINANGQLGTIQSSARYKEAVKPMDKASEAILELKPVTFRYKEELDPDKIPQFGLIAEQVQKIDPDLVVKDEDGKVSTVRYEAVNAMLLNEFLKNHRLDEDQARKLQEQEATIRQLKATVAEQQDAFTEQIAEQQKQIETLTAGVQKLSVQLELAQSAARVVAEQP